MLAPSSAPPILAIKYFYREQFGINLQKKTVLIFQQVNESPETLKYLWYPELEIYGLETFGRQRVLKEMSGVRMGKNKTINYELGSAQ